MSMNLGPPSPPKGYQPLSLPLSGAGGLVENIGVEPMTFPTMPSGRSGPFLAESLVVVENIGVEPMTSCVQGRRSSQLS